MNTVNQREIFKNVPLHEGHRDPSLERRVPRLLLVPVGFKGGFELKKFGY
jgi:hypothetical protein